MEKYSALNVERLMQDFENDKPTLKDVTTLISIMNKAIRLVDDKLRESIANASRLKSYIVAVGLNDQMQNLRKRQGLQSPRSQTETSSFDSRPLGSHRDPG